MMQPVLKDQKYILATLSLDKAKFTNIAAYLIQ